MQIDVMVTTTWLAGNGKSTETLGGTLSIGNLKVCPNNDTLIQQGQIHSNKVTPPNSATPYKIMGANYI